MTIKFGTDGWRGIVGRDFTPENVRRCAKGTASLLKEQSLESNGLVVGYDTRQTSKDSAMAVTKTIIDAGINVYLCNKAAPTPVISYNVVNRNAGAGIIITASHNPNDWNGFKYKPNYGGSASPKIIERLETLINENRQSKNLNLASSNEADHKGDIAYIDPVPQYLHHISTIVDIERIKRSGLNVLIDPMYGSGSGYFTDILSGGNTKITEIHNQMDSEFSGIAHPEPIARNLKILLDSVPKLGADVGLATDGDADRLGVVNERGIFLTSLQSFALLCLYQLEILQNRGPLVKSITMTNMIDKLGAIYGVPVFEAPVGFKYLCPIMMKENALLAGEESGGYAFRGNIPERDGILSGLMILDMMIKTGKTLSELIDILIDKVGPHHYDREDIRFSSTQRSFIEKKLTGNYPHILAGMKVEQIDTRDGIRFVLENGYWSLIRFSGTEPLLRIYAEAESPKLVHKLLKETRNIIGI